MSTPFIPPAPKGKPVEEVYSDESGRAPEEVQDFRASHGLPPVAEVPPFTPDMTTIAQVGSNPPPGMTAPNVVKWIRWGLFWTAFGFAANDFFTAWLVHFFK